MNRIGYPSLQKDQGGEEMWMSQQSPPHLKEHRVREGEIWHLAFAASRTVPGTLIANGSKGKGSDEITPESLSCLTLWKRRQRALRCEPAASLIDGDCWEWTDIVTLCHHHHTSWHLNY